ncbi:MAG: c-type cytochrome domain-containing protein, partial [Pirellula sp.]
MTALRNGVLLFLFLIAGNVLAITNVLSASTFHGGFSPEELSSAQQEEPIDFAREIRPILAKHCYSCHGVDTKEAGLALHEFDLATKETESGIRAVVPGKPDESEMISRIISNDPS